MSATTIPASVEALASLKPAELLAVYNELTGDTVKKFKDAKTAQVRTAKALSLHLSGGDAKSLVKPAKAPKAAAAPKAKKASKKSEANVANNDQPSFRPDSNRGKVILLASRESGARWGKLKEETGWDDGELAAAINRIQHYTKLPVEITGEGDQRLVKVSGELRTRKSFAFEPKKEQKTTTDGSKRSKVLGLLLSEGGTTFEKIMKVAEWDKRTAYEGIRLIHSQLGYGLREDKDGNIFAYTK